MSPPHPGMPYEPFTHYRVSTATPSPRGSPKVHARRATQDFNYSNPRMHQYQYYSPRPSYHAPQQSTPQREPDYVSWSNYLRNKARRAHAPTPGHNAYEWSRSSKQYPQYRQPRQSQFYEDVVTGRYDDEYYSYRDAPPPYEAYYRNERYWQADHNPYHDQVPIYTESAEQPAPNRPRPRRASHSAQTGTTPLKPQRPTTTTGTKPAPKATEEDARRAGIPAGYSYKNWDPTEEPITLLGSVFDANSLGKWVYDWTVFHYGPATPMSEVAGELWLLLIQLAGKVKRADHMMPKIRRDENREMVEEFIDSGERLWIRVKKLLRVCEEYMWKAAKRDTGEKKPLKMGQNTGCEFVDSIFGRDRELERTEKLMTAVRLWSMRFDANCDEILKNPSA